MPETIDRYEILQKLASGGMAELFLAKQSGMEGFEKVVVIKRILTHLATDQEFVSMFLDEARIAAKLSHPNVVQIYDLGRADDTYYIAMEYVSGRNVAHVIKKAKDQNALIPVEHTARIIAGVCDGLYYAHTRKDYDGKPLNIIHRDISPQNILVSFAGGVKLVDFGIAKASTQLAQTRAGVLKGKYSYMSPEQVRGDKIDGRSDIFAVGIVMYEMLTAQRPFERDSSLKTLKAIVQEKPVNPRDLNPTVPPEIVKILSKSLEKDPNRRYANAQEMQMALEDWLDRSSAKSNNVRISRYLYDLFDDELNAEGGTLEVKGVGEVIIPTGASVVSEVDAPGEIEDVPEGTLRAALADVDAAHKRKLAEQEAAKARPATRQATPPPAAPPPQATDPGLDMDMDLGEDEWTGGADEEDGATIVEMDLAKYEAQRQAKAAGVAVPAPAASSAPAARPRTAPAMPARQPPPPEPPPAPSPPVHVNTDDGFNDVPTMNMDAATRDAMLEQARAVVAAQASRAAPPPAPEPARPSAPSFGRPASVVGGPPPPAMLPSLDDEVVPGIGGGPIRPAAPAGAGPVAGIRPAAERNARTSTTSETPAVNGSRNGNGAAAAAKIPLPRVQSSPSLPPVQDNLDASDPAVEPVENSNATRPPKKRANKTVLVVALASVIAVLLGVVIVLLIVDGGAPTVVTGGDPAAGGTEQVAADAPAGKMLVKSSPKGAEIYVNLKLQGKTPTLLGGLEVGKELIILVKHGDMEKRETVTLTKEHEKTPYELNVSLDKKK